MCLIIFLYEMSGILKLAVFLNRYPNSQEVPTLSKKRKCLFLGSLFRLSKHFSSNLVTLYKAQALQAWNTVLTSRGVADPLTFALLDSIK